MLVDRVETPLFIFFQTGMHDIVWQELTLLEQSRLPPCLGGKLRSIFSRRSAIYVINGVP